MGLLIAVKSCWRDLIRGDHEIIRKTWGKDAKGIGIPVLFFVGRDDDKLGGLQNDEVELLCSDDYDSLPFKVREMCRWRLEVDSDTDHMFLCDTDTFVVPRLLIGCGYNQWDFSGRIGQNYPVGTTFHYRDHRGTYPECHPWASGGVGYFLSRRACMYVAETEPKVWAEDLHVGQVCGPLIQSGELIASDLENFECNVAWHFPRRKYNMQSYHPRFKWMEEMYQEYGQ